MRLASVVSEQVCQVLGNHSNPGLPRDKGVYGYLWTEVLQNRRLSNGGWT